MDLEIKLHLCGSLFVYPHFSCVGVAPAVPRPSLPPAVAQRMAYPGPDTGQSVAPQMLARDRREVRFQGAFLLIGARSKSYLPVTFCFILCKGSNKYLAICQKQFFWYLCQNLYVIVGVVFTLCGQGHFVFMMKEGGEGQGEEEGRKYSSGELMLTFEPVCLLHWISTKYDPPPLPPRQHLVLSRDIFCCRTWGGTIDIW